MDNLVNNMKEKINEMNIHLGEKMDDLDERYQAKKFAHTIKHQMKSGLHEEKKVAKKFYKVAKKTGNNIKEEVKKEFNHNDNSLH